MTAWGVLVTLANTSWTHYPKEFVASLLSYTQYLSQRWVRGLPHLIVYWKPLALPDRVRTALGMPHSRYSWPFPTLPGPTCTPKGWQNMSYPLPPLTSSSCVSSFINSGFALVQGSRGDGQEGGVRKGWGVCVRPVAPRYQEQSQPFQRDKDQ